MQESTSDLWFWFLASFKKKKTVQKRTEIEFLLGGKFEVWAG